MGYGNYVCALPDGQGRMNATEWTTAGQLMVAQGKTVNRRYALGNLWGFEEER
jgi:hypothetical protein